MRIQRSRRDHFFMGPEALVQVLPRQRPTQVTEQAPRQAVFTFRHDHCLTFAGDSQLGIVEGQVIETQHLGGGTALLAVPAQYGGDSGFQLVGAERFADVIVGTSVQGLDDIAFAVAAGQHDRGGRRLHVFTGPAQQCEAAQVGQLPVEDQQVESVPAQLAQQVLTPFKAVQRPWLVAHGRHLLQGLLDPAQFGGFIVQYRNAHTRGFLVAWAVAGNHNGLACAVKVSRPPSVDVRYDSSDLRPQTCGP
ncbi:hypothetical protein EMIT0215P_110116 [Pseudomonas serboccidentalis]